MKKKSFVTLVVLFFLCGVFTPGRGQQNNTIPLLLQQNQLQQGPPRPMPPPAPPVGNVGVPVVQSISIPDLLSHLPLAIQTAQKLSRLFTPGKVWFSRAPGGELIINAGLLYQGVVVAVLQFNPVDGSLLPLGVHPSVFQTGLTIPTVQSELDSVLNQLKVSPTAEFMEPETCWQFPVTFDDMVVAHVKIYYDGIHVVQDYVANREMLFYGR